MSAYAMLRKKFLSKALMQLNGKKILIVEPSLHHRDTIKRFTHNLCFAEVITTRTTEFVEEIIKREKISIVIIEWKSNPCNGLELCRRIREKYSYSDLPILITSDENQKNDIMLIAEAGANSYLIKPFSYELFCDHLEKLANCLISANLDNMKFEIIENMLKERSIDGENPEANLDGLSLDIDVDAIDEYLPKGARLSTIKGMLELEKGNFGIAVTFLKQALVHNPEYLKALKLLSKCYERQGNLLDSYKIMCRLQGKSPHNPSYSLRCGYLAIKLKDLDMAEQFFLDTLVHSPLLAKAYYGLGTVYMKRHDYERAHIYFKKALDIDASDIQALNGYGLSMVKQERISEGIKFYNLALSMEPGHPRVLFNLGYAYEKLGEFGKAKIYYSRALDADPTYQKAARRMSLVARKTEQIIAL